MSRRKSGHYVPPQPPAQFSRFLDHPNARVRELARRILAEQRCDAEEEVPDTTTHQLGPGGPADDRPGDPGLFTSVRDPRQDER